MIKNLFSIFCILYFFTLPLLGQNQNHFDLKIRSGVLIAMDVSQDGINETDFSTELGYILQGNLSFNEVINNNISPFISLGYMQINYNTKTDFQFLEDMMKNTITVLTNTFEDRRILIDVGIDFHNDFNSFGVGLGMGRQLSDEFASVWDYGYNEGLFPVDVCSYCKLKKTNFSLNLNYFRKVFSSKFDLGIDFRYSLQNQRMLLNDLRLMYSSVVITYNL